MKAHEDFYDRLMDKICSIEWNSLSPHEWEKRFNTLRRSNILQCYTYALALCPINQHSARWGLIKMNGAEAGLVQIMEVALFKKAFHVVMLDRGPLWFDGFGAREDWDAFFKVFNREFKPRLGRKRRIIPETALEILPSARKQPYPAYQTIWIDLTQSAEDLRAALRKNWRSALKKAESFDLKLASDAPLKHLPWLLKHYQLDKQRRKYRGAAPKTLTALAQHFAPLGNVLLLRARKDGRDIAAILIFIHGKAATYQIGWTSPDLGRKCNAHHYLLWQAMDMLKARGVEDLDLGGVNDLSAKGVKSFKEGLGGELIELCGQYK